MTWLAWRQVRAQAGAVVALVLVAVAVLWGTGRSMHLVVARAGTAFDALTSADRTLFYTGIAVVAVAPALVGIFWGAPMVARELESGTHRLVWNQSVTRVRWLSVKLGLTSAVAAAAVATLCLAVDWWAGPVDGATSATRGGLPGRLTPIGFAMRGVVPVAYTVFAVVLGVAIGLAVRRTLPAMALTLVVFAAVQVAVPLWVRPHLAPAVDTTVGVTERHLDGLSLAADGSLTLTLTTGGTGDWLLDDTTLDPQGRATVLPSWFAACTAPQEASDGTAGTQRSQAPPVDPCLTRLDSEGYTQHLRYQPREAFWRLQLTESAMFLTVSGLLVAGCLWWVRRRDA